MVRLDSPRFPDLSGFEDVQAVVSSVLLPADAARPLLLFGQGSESHNSLSFVVTMQETRTPSGRSQPPGSSSRGLEMLQPGWSLGRPADLQMLGLGPASLPGCGLSPSVHPGVSVDCEGLCESIPWLPVPLEYDDG